MEYWCEKSRIHMVRLICRRDVTENGVKPQSINQLFYTCQENNTFWAVPSHSEYLGDECFNDDEGLRNYPRSSDWVPSIIISFTEYLLKQIVPAAIAVLMYIGMSTPRKQWKSFHRHYLLYYNNVFFFIWFPLTCDWHFVDRLRW